MSNRHITRSVTNMGDPLFSLESQIDDDKHENSEGSLLKNTFFISANNKKKKRQNKSSSTSNSDDSSEESDSGDDKGSSVANKYFKIKFKKKKILGQIEKLEKQNKQISTDLRTCQSELDRIREENVILRDANIQFQVQIFKLRMQNQMVPKVSTPIQQNHSENLSSKLPEITKVQSINFSTLSQKIVQQPSTLQFAPKPILIEKTEKQQKQCEENSQTNVQDIEENTDCEMGDEEEDLEVEDEYQRVSDKDTTSSQSDIQSRYKIKLGPLKLEQLNDVPSTAKFDSKFVNLLLTWLFDKETLLNASVTGKRYTSKVHPYYDNRPLDKRRLQFMKAMLQYRVNLEKVNKQQNSARMKRFNGLVKTKIGNLKFNEKRVEQTKIQNAVIAKIEQFEFKPHFPAYD